MAWHLSGVPGTIMRRTSRQIERHALVTLLVELPRGFQESSSFALLCEHASGVVLASLARTCSISVIITYQLLSCTPQRQDSEPTRHTSARAHARTCTCVFARAHARMHGARVARSTRDVRGRNGVHMHGARYTRTHGACA